MKEGSFQKGGLIKKINESELGEKRYVIVVPKQFRKRVMKAAHDRMGHQYIKKVLPMITIASSLFRHQSLYQTVPGLSA